MTSKNTDLAILLGGISEVPKIGLPALLSVFGPEAFAVLVAKGYDDSMHPIAAASRYGDGRVVIFSHDGYIFPEATPPEGRQFLSNCLTWAGGYELPDVALFECNRELVPYLTGLGMTVSTLTGSQLNELSSESGQVLMIGNSDRLDDVKNSAILKFIEEGGGVLAGNTTWAGWDDTHIKDKDWKDNPGNKLVQNFGLAWTPDYVKASTVVSNAFPTNLSRLEDTNAGTGWKTLVAAFNDKTVLPESRTKQIEAVVLKSLQFVSDQAYLDGLHGDVESLSVPSPSESNPVTDHIARTILVCADKVLGPINPACKLFPGLCKSADTGTCNTPFVFEMKPISAAGWYSTGYYATPGKQITVTITDHVGFSSKLRVRIGAHSDSLMNNDVWKRFPVITNESKTVVGGAEVKVSISSKFGGLIYLSVVEDVELHSCAITFDGAVQAPHYIHGRTTLEEWQNAIRNYDAPWGELETQKLILTLPSDALSKLDDPITLMNQWDQVMDALADICSIPHERKRPERIVADVQISGGWMHSAYPIMMHLASVKTSLDVAELRTSEAWGYYHELGHNHQKSPDYPFTWAGAIEVTNNVMAVYVFNVLFGLSWAQARPDPFEPEKLKQTISDYLGKGTPTFSPKLWEDQPFLALMKYYQLQQLFGWDAFKKVFGVYEKLPKADWPKTDEAKIDLWVKTFSTVVGQNLIPFYKSWGFEIGQKVADDLSSLAPSTMKIQDLLK